MMDHRVLSLEETLGESPALWSIRDFPNHIIYKPSKLFGLDVFWESESESQSQEVVSEAEFATLEDTHAGPQPSSIQHKIKSLLLDIDNAFGDRILVQFWAPIRTASGQRMLTASHQPFGIGDRLYEGLCRFRKYCAEHQYGVSVEDTTLLGPPGRVFTLGSPELCPDVQYYSHEEFPLKKHALDCCIGLYAALPLFERDGQSCVGVLELSSLYVGFSNPLKVVLLEKYGLQHHVHICKWDKAPPSTPQTRQTIRSLAQFVELKYGLGVVQVWVPCLCHIAPDGTSSGQYDAHNSCSSSNPASPSPITTLFRDCFIPSEYETPEDVPGIEPCWVRNDTSLVGRAYSQKKPCFARDIKQFNIFDYPLLPVLRWFELKACFAIPLQLIDPKFDPFVLEIFFPDQPDGDRNVEDILEPLLFTLKEEYSTDQLQVEKFSVKLSHSDYDNIAYLGVYQNGSSDAIAQKRLNDHPNATGDKAKTSCSRKVKVSPYAPRAKITLDDITPLVGLKLKDAAKKLGVGGSSLKRQCRDLGIGDWRSLRSENVRRIQSSPRSPTRFVEGGAEVFQESEIEPPCPNNNQSERDAAAPDTIPKCAKGNNIAAQDEMDLDHSYTMIVKATYKDDTVKFPLGSNSGIEELCRELDERFEFEAERFKIKYEDEGDWILLSCDKDLRFRMDDLKSSGQTTMHVSIFPATL